MLACLLACLTFGFSSCEKEQLRENLSTSAFSRAAPDTVLTPEVCYCTFRLNSNTTDSEPGHDFSIRFEYMDENNNSQAILIGGAAATHTYDTPDVTLSVPFTTKRNSDYELVTIGTVINQSYTLDSIGIDANVRCNGDIPNGDTRHLYSYLGDAPVPPAQLIIDTDNNISGEIGSCIANGFPASF